MALRILALAALTFSATTLASNSNVTCNADSDNPSTGGVTNVINQVRPMDDCAQSNGWGNKCRTVVSHDDAEIRVCGASDGISMGLPCAKVAEYANEVQQTCLDDAGTVSGGTYKVSSTRWIEVVKS